MKKITTLLFTLLTLPAFAENNIQKDTTPVSTESYPKLKLAVYDFSNNVRREVEGRKYSIKNKHHQLCWVAFNMPLQFKNKVTERFVSPGRLNFMDQSVQSNSSEDGKTHIVSSTLESLNNEYVARCWAFDEKDPKGKYTLEVNLNEVSFPPQEFEIIE